MTSAVQRVAVVAVIVAWAMGYASYYPPENFLWTCNLGVLLTAAAVAIRSRLTLSAVLIVVALPDIGWTLDVIWRSVAGNHLIGGTEYMFDERIPIVIRLLSFEHLLLAPLLVTLLWRRGYDPRALYWAAPVLFMLYYVTYLVADPAWEVNWVYGLFGTPQTFMPPGLYPLVAAMIFVTVILLPGHFLARKFLPDRETGKGDE